MTGLGWTLLVGAMGGFVGKPCYMPIELLVIIFYIVHVDFYGVSVLKLVGFLVVTIDVLKGSTSRAAEKSYKICRWL